MLVTNSPVSNGNPVGVRVYRLRQCLLPMMGTRPTRERDDTLTRATRVRVSAPADRLPDGVRMWDILVHILSVPAA